MANLMRSLIETALDEISATQKYVDSKYKENKDLGAVSAYSSDPKRTMTNGHSTEKPSAARQQELHNAKQKFIQDKTYVNNPKRDTYEHSPQSWKTGDNAIKKPEDSKDKQHMSVHTQSGDYTKDKPLAKLLSKHECAGMF